MSFSPPIFHHLFLFQYSKQVGSPWTLAEMHSSLKYTCAPMTWLTSFWPGPIEAPLALNYRCMVCFSLHIRGLCPYTGLHTRSNLFRLYRTEPLDTQLLQLTTWYSLQDPPSSSICINNPAIRWIRPLSFFMGRDQPPKLANLYVVLYQKLPTFIMRSSSCDPLHERKITTTTTKKNPPFGFPATSAL